MGTSLAMCNLQTAEPSDYSRGQCHSRPVKGGVGKGKSINIIGGGKMETNGLKGQTPKTHFWGLSVSPRAAGDSVDFTVLFNFRAKKVSRTELHKFVEYLKDTLASLEVTTTTIESRRSRLYLHTVRLSGREKRVYGVEGEGLEAKLMHQAGEAWCIHGEIDSTVEYIREYFRMEAKVIH
jgi:hypothetical protein